ncbi:MAG: hypothetical protein KDC71_24340 [Acidobacteria bacterium]|nr:hypothetical protein [Acidobacteriota bacterium]
MFIKIIVMVQDCECDLNLIRNDDLLDNRQAVVCFCKGGKHSIEILLSEISNPKISEFDLQSPFSSYYLLEKQMTGIFAAYIVELILSGKKIDDSFDLKYPVSFLKEDEYLYLVGMIFCKKNHQPIGHSRKKMREISKIYLDWWLVNKDKSLIELREQWSKGFRPLTGSEYYWR